MSNDASFSSREGFVGHSRGRAGVDHETSVDEAIERLTNVLRNRNLAEVECLANHLGELARDRNDSQLLAVARLGRAFVFWAWGTP